MFINLLKLCIDIMIILCIKNTMIRPAQYLFFHFKTLIYAQICEKQLDLFLTIQL